MTTVTAGRFLSSSVFAVVDWMVFLVKTSSSSDQFYVVIFLHLFFSSS